LSTAHFISTQAEPGFAAWFDALVARHTAHLEFAEIRRALQALSTIYVQRRDKLPGGRALDSPGKRAAFALFYTPLHTLICGAVYRALPLLPCTALLDLGCGTGAAGLAWALQGSGADVGAGPGAGPGQQLFGVDINPWVLAEARWNWRHAAAATHLRRGNVASTQLPPSSHVVLGWVVNELDDAARTLLLPRLLDGPQQCLILEPIAKRAAPWFAQWEAAFLAAGGRSDTWEIAMDLPEKLALLDRAAGMRHGRVKVRSLFLVKKSGRTWPAAPA
jgi:hypothetical protein